MYVWSRRNIRRVLPRPQPDSEMAGMKQGLRAHAGISESDWVLTNEAKTETARAR